MIDIFSGINKQSLPVAITLVFISIFIGYIIEKFRSKKFDTTIKKINVIVSPLTMILFLLLSGFSITPAIKNYILFTILFHASYCDIKSREVDDYISVMIVLTGFIGFKEVNFVPMLLGALVVFLPQIIMTVFSKSIPIGGADIKISTACGFVFGANIGLSSLLIGLLLAVIVNTIVAKCKKQKNISFPFIPYYCCGLIGLFLFYNIPLIN